MKTNRKDRIQQNQTKRAKAELAAKELKERKGGKSGLCVLLWLMQFPTAGAAATLYVWQDSPSPVPPYTNWATAAHVIQDAVDAAAPGDTVLVTNGVYSTGGRAVYGTMTNRLAVDKPLSLLSVNGPQVTIIQGYQVPGTTNGDGAVRCAYLTNGASLSGFTLTNGATQDWQSVGDYEKTRTGGGVLCESATAVLTNCMLMGNCADRGGGAYGGTLRYCSLIGNSALQLYLGSGGGAYGSMLYQCTLEGNSARSVGGSGGGASSGILTNCTLIGNSAAQGGGGAFGCTLDHCTLSGNSALYGGGAYVGTLDDCTLASNSASFSGTTGSGGGAHSAALNNCTVTNNWALTGGGASVCVLNNCTLSGNTATDSGGGAFGGTLHSSTLTGNEASRGGGAAGEPLTTSCMLTNCTLIGNSASDTGGGTFSATLKNCIVYYNTARVSGDNYDPAHTTLDYSCTTPLPVIGTGNRAGEPQLASISHLSASSPCRGAGNSAYASGLDIDGEPWANPPSIGCDEYWSGSVTGPVTVTIAAPYTNAAVGFSLDLQAIIGGRVSASRWDFGDGVVVSNRPLASHAWATAGSYMVELRAYSESYPGGVAASVMVQVVDQPVSYVSLNSTTPAPPYDSWATAATNIQDAVNAAFLGGLVLVSNGVYATGATAVYGMSNRVAVTKPLTVQSVNGPGVTTIAGYPVPGTEAVRCVYLVNGAVLSGFTLTSGATQTSGDLARNSSGAGVWCESTNAVVINCVLKSNSVPGYPSFGYGGGAYYGTLSNCTLAGNWAPQGGGAYGATLNNCDLTGNSAGSGGGAYRCTLNNCNLTGNSTGDYAGGGGGASASILTNCKLIGNRALAGGGADGCILNNCTLIGNSASYGNTGGAGYGGGAYDCTLSNSIVYYNRAVNGANWYSGAISFSCSTPLPPGPGNTSSLPLFVDTNGWSNLRLQPNSPCINAGNNAYVSTGTDLDGRPRIVGGTVDMGAYEFQGPGQSEFIGWLQQHALPTDGSADFTDADTDGHNNWQEWKAWTVPTNAFSVLKLLTPQPDAGGTLISWQSVAGQSYLLERAANASGGFTLLQSNLVGQAGTTSFTDTNASGANPFFYRVGVGN